MADPNRPQRTAAPNHGLHSSANRPDRQLPPSQYLAELTKPEGSTTSLPQPPTLSYSGPGAGPSPNGPAVKFDRQPSETTVGASTANLLRPGMQEATSFSGADFKRKKSLVRPDRERVDENHRLYNYRQALDSPRTSLIPRVQAVHPKLEQPS